MASSAPSQRSISPANRPARPPWAENTPHLTSGLKQDFFGALGIRRGSGGLCAFLVVDLYQVPFYVGLCVGFCSHMHTVNAGLFRMVGSG